MTTVGTLVDQIGYAGDISVEEAWNMLKEDPKSTLVDVRTNAEWNFVGLPDLSALDKSVQTISWALFPTMTPNPDFAEALKACHPDMDAPILFLCRTGVRSIAAAKTATAMGYKHCYNILDGFEGSPDQNRHRGTTNGWKAKKLDWVQN
ncbi:rhodanese-like domain-containing protein [Sneathiella chinensis]|uniref:Sulfurtransferase n=1 Tax=Sneathiella chinensis TaxID=349750 RepID=A0ABQ5U329_9PROT|nr:rhodanese-like domain-containing protein [Sneathiella chinensis]GLQ04901.1 sulfurtransferase [Sneathiella chinensis]